LLKCDLKEFTKAKQINIESKQRINKFTTFFIYTYFFVTAGRRTYD